MEGFNAVGENLDQSVARIGIIANQQNDCSSCDSRIGFGTGGLHDDSNTCGNEAKHKSNNGDKHIKAMGSSSQTHMAMFRLFLLTRIFYNVLNEILRPSFIRVVICGLKLISQIKKGYTLVCSAHFKPDYMYRTITGLTRLKRGAVPSQFAWTKEGKERRPNKLEESKTIVEQQAQEQRRQFFVDSIQQDVEMEEEETASAGLETNASAEPMQVTSVDRPENENSQPDELSPEEQNEIF
ncbi:hypothetical protein AWC38_SpisGene21627 [Stylophora pistillata]|uniref:THAP-type domain-containing protein n=1 Tax=Stylophora pistillata TaxID=50429 RepID=A0A2B4RDA7_STYPI|nr:hypothetical protein AWC38_SpisGene21627 [Stylophora pistillata]